MVVVRAEVTQVVQLRLLQEVATPITAPRSPTPVCLAASTMDRALSSCASSSGMRDWAPSTPCGISSSRLGLAGRRLPVVRAGGQRRTRPPRVPTWRPCRWRGRWRRPGAGVRPAGDRGGDAVGPNARPPRAATPTTLSAVLRYESFAMAGKPSSEVDLHDGCPFDRGDALRGERSSGDARPRKGFGLRRYGGHNRVDVSGIPEMPDPRRGAVPVTPRAWDIADEASTTRQRVPAGVGGDVRSASFALLQRAQQSRTVTTGTARKCWAKSPIRSSAHMLRPLKQSKGP